MFGGLINEPRRRSVMLVCSSRQSRGGEKRDSDVTSSSRAWDLEGERESWEERRGLRGDWKPSAPPVTKTTKKRKEALKTDSGARIPESNCPMGDPQARVWIRD